jgi:trans-2,3-dihydro-3-hydroxyanthranilate isomerase
MEQIQPVFGLTHSAETISAMLSLNTHDIDSRFPIQTVSTGLPFIMVPLTSLVAVKHATLRHDLYKKFIHLADANAIFFFCSETYDPSHQINARMFADELGVTEDPATGSANGCLAAYLTANQYFGTSMINIRVEQGYEIQRPSVLHLNAQKNETSYQILVGGQVIYVARGELYHNQEL